MLPAVAAVTLLLLLLVLSGIMADPWFRTDLPPDALHMNDKYLANTRSCPQSETDIKSIVAAATN